MTKGMFRRACSFLLIFSLLAGCGSVPSQTDPPETVSSISTELKERIEIPVETETVSLQAESSEDDSILELSKQPHVSGALTFRVENVKLQVGGPVSDFIGDGVELGADPSALLEPGQISGNISIRIKMDGVSLDKEPILFFHAVNDSAEQRMISQCRIYSVIINTQSGIQFGCEDYDATFISGLSTIDEIKHVYGEPDYYRANGEKYEEMAYYAPFDSVYFSFQNGTVRQIMAIYAPQKTSDTKELEKNGYFGYDALLTMGKYLDVSAYLPSDAVVDRGTSVDLEECITVGDVKLKLGSAFTDLPEMFSQPYEGAPLDLASNHYILTGKGNAEELFLLNDSKRAINSFRYCTLIGVVTHNAEYTNWGSDYADHNPFQYQGIDHHSTIEDIISNFGLPQELHATSSAHACFVWMHYRDQKGNELRIRVDPMLDAIVELRVMKYYPNAVAYE